jgi:hypothetical protein
LELVHDRDNLLTRSRISDALRTRRERGLTPAGKQSKRLPYPEDTLRDLRMRSGMTLEEIWAKLLRRKEFCLARFNNADAWAPEYASSLVWTETHGSKNAEVIRAFADVLELKVAVVEKALSVPIKYKRAGCTTVKTRWEHAKSSNWPITFEMDGTPCPKTTQE